MTNTITVNVPHNLGKDEARRRLENGFAGIQQQLAGGAMRLASFQQRWKGDRMHFEGSALGQQITGRIEVLDDAVQIQLDLPMLVAAIAGRLKAGLTNATRKLLEKK